MELDIIILPKSSNESQTQLELKYYMTANKDLIEEEIQNAKREEIRGSLGDLVAYMEEA